MKTFIASDFHGTSPVSLVRSLVENEGIGKAYLLGDYDDPEILRDILNLDIDKVVLIGNHEYNFCRGSELYSKYLREPLEEYWEMWGDTEEGRFARECPLKVVEDDVVYLHGSLHDPYCGGKQEIWGRLFDAEELGFSEARRLICNFREMKKENYWTMFRGHDHESAVYFTDKGEYQENFKQIHATIFDMVLDKEDMNIVSVGPFVEGEYCIFDDESLKLEFRNALDYKNL